MKQRHAVTSWVKRAAVAQDVDGHSQVDFAIPCDLSDPKKGFGFRV